MIFSKQHQEMLLLLSCYLPYGIEVQHSMLGIGTLVGLPWAPAWERPRVEVRFHDHELLQDYDLCDVKPILWGFEDLATPMNGVVPAVQVMMHQGYATNRIEVGDKWPNVIYFNLDGQRTSSGLWRSNFEGSCTLSTAQYLRSQHFAVGLREEQYIRKVA